jgi:NurA-like 5'-3' nuclease
MMSERKGKRAELDKLMREQRDEVCAAKPGGPERYRLVVSASCVSARKPKSVAAKTRGVTKNLDQRKVVEAELTIVKEYVELLHKQKRFVPGVHGHEFFATYGVFTYMIRPDFRTKYPDPIMRFDMALSHYLNNDVKENKERKTTNVYKIHVFNLLASHLRSVLTYI